jgi:molybdopterin-guanine dinucleotide biosynthesis protein B
MRILCFTGDSGAGKTTLIERLLSHLPLEAASMGILKHTHHRLDWHPPGKDTTRFWQTGVGSVAVVDPAQIACFQRADHAGLVTGCRLFPQHVELVLVEGYSRSRAPMVWLTVHPPGTVRGPPQPELRAIVTTHQNVAGWSSEQPGTLVVTRDKVGTIARHVWDWAVELDELALPMSPSASRP